MRQGNGTDSPPATIAAHLHDRAADTRTGLVFEDATWTWAEVVSEARVRAALLRRLRREGPFHVGVLLDNVPEYVFLLFGTALAGATVVGVNSTRRGAELERDIRHTDCATVITDSGYEPLLAGLDLGVDGDHVLIVDSPGYRRRLEDDPADAPPWEPPGAGDLYLLLFTAGSTGAPKAVRMSQGRAAATAAASARAFTPDDVLYCAMPLFHGNALLSNLFAGLVSGAAVVLRRRFSARGFGPDIRRYGCTFFNYVGRALSYIVAVPESPEDADNRLRWALGSEASPQDAAEFTRRFGCPVFEGYGSSEGAVVISPVPGTPPTALGRPRRGQDVAVVDRVTGRECPRARLDADGRLLNPEEAIGEIASRGGAARFEGYYNNAEADRERTRDGWYWTGDLGYRDADGYFYFAGRTADWLRVDGENFSAGSVERILNRFRGLSGAVVYAVPDPTTGDQVMAALQMAPGATFDPEVFAGFLGAQRDLGTKWAPRFVRVVEALPVTGSGKVDKAPLRAERWETVDPVWWRPTGRGPYRRLTRADADELRHRFADKERGSVIG